MRSFGFKAINPGNTINSNDESLFMGWGFAMPDVYKYLTDVIVTIPGWLKLNRIISTN